MSDHRLAIDGGTPAIDEPLPAWPVDDPQIRAALNLSLDDGSWGRYHGPHVEALSAALRQLAGVEHVYPCCSGTFAVELALRAVRVATGDEVALGAYDFPGNFRAIEAIGARPVLVDVDARSGSLDPVQLEAAWSPQLRAVVVSHLHGALADLPRIVDWARAKNIAVVEDACQAVGATLAGRAAGAWGDVGVYSFGGSKLLSAGRGGAIVTSHADVHQRAKIFCEQGNHAFPLSELQAAVLVPQIVKLPERHTQRARAVARLHAKLQGLAGLRLFESPDVAGDPAYYKLGLHYEPAALGAHTRAQFIAAAQAEGAPIDAGFRGLAERSTSRARKVGPLDEARRVAAQTLLVHHPILLAPDAMLDRLSHALAKVCRAWSGAS